MANFEVSIAENNIDVVLDELSKSEEAILEAIGLQAESYAKLKCPVKTGLLRNSITHAIGGKGAAETQYQDDNGEQSGSYEGTAPDEKAVFIGTNVEYAAEVEMGTDKVRSRPYIEPAVTEHGEEYRKIAESILKNGE